MNGVLRAGGASRPSAGDLAAALFDFERADVRTRAVLVMLGAALISPNIYLPAGLPAVRLEQGLLLIFVVPFICFVARHPEARWLGAIDLTFAALTAALAASIVLAPIVVPSVGRSWHDVFVILRPIQYWLMYRLALASDASERSARATLALVFAVSIAAGVFALFQFLGPGSFNAAITSIWTTGHNLDGVIRSRRVVGTSNSADVFAMIACLFLLASFWAIVLRPLTSRRQTVLTVAAMGAGVLGLVLAISRGATIAAIAGLLVGAAVVIVSRRATRWHAAIPLLGACIAMSAAVLVLVPSLAQAAPVTTQPAVSRFSVTGLATDPSVVLRVERLKLLLSDSGAPPATAGLCAGTTAAPMAPGHEPVAARPGATTSGPPPTQLAAARARDAQRKRDVAAISAALDRSYCATGAWPTGDLTRALSAAGLSPVPTDPTTGASYVQVVGQGGYLVSATLEDGTDPDGPVYAASNQPNLVKNSSFELGTPTPTDWQTDDATKAITTSSGPKFGARAGEVTLSPNGYLFAYVVYTLGPSSDYSASIWMRSATGTTQQVRFYLTAILADGTRISPAASVTPRLPADGSWVRATLPFRTPSTGLVYTMQLVVQPWPTAARAQIAVDGAVFTATPVAPAYALTRDVDPSTLKSTIPSWLDSPVVGLGPMNVLQIGGDPGEYALVLVRSGIMGVLTYLALFGATAWLLLKAWRRESGARAILALTGLTATAVGAVFAATTATFYNYQLMGIYWLLVGLILARGPGVPGPSTRLPGVIRRPRGSTSDGSSAPASR